MIIAIDGPAGSGKSTTAKQVAGRLGYLYIDTGAMYRAVALAFIRKGETPTDEAAETILPDVRIDLRHAEDRLEVYLNGENVSSPIRGSEVTSAVSDVAALAAVRTKLVDEQRRVAREYDADGEGVVLDGRDIGTVVFPDADVKVFMVADDRVRAERRHEELLEKGEDVALEDVLTDIQKRDQLDSSRKLAPLRKADDALVINTTDLSVDEQVNVVIEAVKERQNLSAV